MDAGSRSLVADALGVLVFRRPSGRIETHWRGYLACGLLMTWLAGIGRYWDSPRAELWQHLGLGSVVYVFVLALIVWLFVLPLRPERWSYRGVLVFVSLTSPPALLYAIPVERFLPMESAQTANVWFLALVALWRVALLLWFLRTSARLPGVAVLVVTLLPLALIVVSLSVLNLEHVVFNLMAGIRDEHRSGNDAAYLVVLTLGYLSVMATPLLAIGYAVVVVWVRRSRPHPGPG